MKQAFEYSVSSCWNSHRHEDGLAMLEELKGLGFDWVELSHGVRLSLIPGILKGVDDGLMKVSSVHNFCPLPPGVMGAAPNLYEPTARSQIERDMWRSHTLKTIDFAHRVKARLVVVHCGSIRPFFLNGERTVERLQQQADGVEKVKAWLNKKKGPYMERLVESLGSVVERARERGIKLALENREGLLELPLDADWGPFLEQLGAEDVIGYWHDSGHAQIKMMEGFLEHGPFLRALRARQWGFHLHDVSEEGRDHQAPGEGTIDWPELVAQFREGDTLVFEMSPRLRSETIREGLAFVRAQVEER